MNLASDPALILDMDGVIIDSNPVHSKVWADYNRRFGIETTEAMQQRMYGRRNDEIVRDFFGPRLTEEQVRAHGAAKEQLYRETIAPMIEDLLVPGVRTFLERRREQAVALATNAEPANVQFVLEAAHLRQYFRTVVDGHQVTHPKPDPEIYLCAAERLGISPRRCVVFEDSVTGVAAARAAGMTVVGVSTTHSRLPGVDLQIQDFNSPGLEPWLANR